MTELTEKIRRAQQCPKGRNLTGEVVGTEIGVHKDGTLCHHFRPSSWKATGVIDGFLRATVITQYGLVDERTQDRFTNLLQKWRKDDASTSNS